MDSYCLPIHKMLHNNLIFLSTIEHNTRFAITDIDQLCNIDTFTIAQNIRLTYAKRD